MAYRRSLIMEKSKLPNPQKDPKRGRWYPKKPNAFKKPLRSMSGEFELAEGQNLGAKQQRVLLGLATEDRVALRVVYKFLRDTLLTRHKKTADADAAADKE